MNALKALEALKERLDQFPPLPPVFLTAEPNQAIKILSNPQSQSQAEMQARTPAEWWEALEKVQSPEQAANLLAEWMLDWEQARDRDEAPGLQQDR